MNPEERADNLDAELKEQEGELEKLQSSVAENKEASKELDKSLDELESATEKLADEKRLSRGPNAEPE
jgi:uncharacterized coiled-coil protein SlyX